MALNLSTSPSIFQRPQNLLTVTLIANTLAFVTASHQSPLSIHPAPRLVPARRTQCVPLGEWHTVLSMVGC